MLISSGVDSSTRAISGGGVINSKLNSGTNSMLNSRTWALSALISARLKWRRRRSGDSGIEGRGSSYLSYTGLLAATARSKAALGRLTRSTLRDWSGKSGGGVGALFNQKGCSLVHFTKGKLYTKYQDPDSRDENVI